MPPKAYAREVYMQPYKGNLFRRPASVGRWGKGKREGVHLLSTSIASIRGHPCYILPKRVQIHTGSTAVFGGPCISSATAVQVPVDPAPKHWPIRDLWRERRGRARERLSSRSWSRLRATVWVVYAAVVCSRESVAGDSRDRDVKACTASQSTSSSRTRPFIVPRIPTHHHSTLIKGTQAGDPR